MLFKIEDASANEEMKFETENINRHSLEYTDCSNRFYKASRDFSKQYAHIYSARLSTFRNILSEVIKKKWSNKYKVLKLCDLRDKSTKCIVVGTLFKHQELKPSILKELSDELDILPQPTRTHFVHESDTLVLEDELQRIKLVGDCIDINQVVTGVVCAVLGAENEDGVFTVEDVCWPGCSLQKPLPKLEDDRYIVIMSGLNMSSKMANHRFALNLLVEWLAGLSGSSEYQAEVSKIVRVIIAGGLFRNNDTEAILNEADVIDSIQTVDSFCSTISAVAPLDLMPGCKDPAGIMLPQKPFHYCLFPKAVEYKSFNRVSNPYECDIGGFNCIGSSGEPIKDILRFSIIPSGMAALKKSLEWRHLAPSGPDTVPCTPCIQTDPFTIANCPHVYFTGNAQQFSTELYIGEDGQKVRLVTVPDFFTTKTVAVVNLANLECFSMAFE